MANALDAAIAWFSPQRGFERLRARSRMQAMQKATALYEGATIGRRSHGWRAAATDADAEIRAAAHRLRNVSRDMIRNNPLAARAVQIIDQNVVGSGIVPSVTSKSKQRTAELRRLIKEHLETTLCDVEGRNDFYGIQALVMRTVVESGEALVRRRLSADRRLPLPFQLQVLEPDYLDTNVDGALPGGGYAIQGIEFDAKGARVAYHLYDRHPGSIGSTWTHKSTRVPASEVAHIYRMDRPGQMRGVTWFAPVILRMRDLADFTDAQLVRQKIAACFAMVITRDEDEVYDPSKPKDGDTGYNIETMAPGMVEYTRRGEKVEWGEPPQVGDFDPYTRATQREIAAGLGITYEALSTDGSQVNFSSGRMNWIEFQRAIDAWRWRTLIPQLCAPVAAWTIETSGIVLASTQGAEIGWTPPRREMVNPKEEIPVARDAVRAGLSSRSEEARKLGYDPELIEREIADDNTRADTLGLKFDSDGRFPITDPIGGRDPANDQAGRSAAEAQAA